MSGAAPAGDMAFTCLIPVHGGDQAEPFAAAMRSIAGATLRPNETLICQDGDLPAALERTVASQATGLGARILRNPGRRGVQHAFNHAMREVVTPFVARADADDINLPRRFETQVRFLRENPQVAALGGAISEFWPDGRRRTKLAPLTHDEIVRWACWRSPINNNTAFFRTDAFLACGGYPDIPLKEDYGFYLSMIERGFLLANLSDVLVEARLGDNFYARRAGLRNVSSEYQLYRIKRRIPRIGGLTAAAALVARVGALGFEGPTRLVYEVLLRR